MLQKMLEEKTDYYRVFFSSQLANKYASIIPDAAKRWPENIRTKSLIILCKKINSSYYIILDKIS